VIVVYTPGNRVYHSTPTERSGQSDAENRLPRRLFIAVAVLGLATYGLSFGPVVDGGGATGWSVRFAALAALCAAFSLLPRQSPQTLVTAALATMGFLDALSSVLTADAGWPLTVIVALNAVQAAAAIAALALWRNPGAGNTASAGYDAYVDYYNQAIRQYYGQQAPVSTQAQTSERSGYGQASRGAQAAATASAAARSSQPGDYADLLSPQGEYDQSVAAQTSPTGPIRSVPPPGLPGFRPAQTRAGQPDEHAERPERGSWPQ
jgi:uncharacterized protein DUF5336